MDGYKYGIVGLIAVLLFASLVVADGVIDYNILVPVTIGDVAIGYVPYIGAIANVNLGIYNITANTGFLTYLNVTNDSNLADVYPQQTLTYDLGSGALRWRALYVQDVNAEEIETYNIHILENITLDGYINGVNLSDIGGGNTSWNQSFADTLYVPYTGATVDVHLDTDSRKLYFGAGDDYSIEWDGSDAVHTISAGDFVFSGGNVGIGTASPGAMLDILPVAVDDIGFKMIAKSGQTADLVQIFDSSAYYKSFKIDKDAKISSSVMQFPSVSSNLNGNLFYSKFRPTANINGNMVGNLFTGSKLGDFNLNGYVYGLANQASSSGTGDVKELTGLSNTVYYASSGSLTRAIAGKFYISSGSANDVTNAVALNVLSFIKYSTGGVINNYGLKMEDMDEGTTLNYAIHTGLGEVSFGDDVHLRVDGDKHYFGAGDDSSIYYNSTDMIINPAEVGSGDLVVTGNLAVTNNITGNQIYGGMWYHNHTATELNFAVDGTYYPLFMTNATHLNGFSFLGGFGLPSNLTAQVAGLYQVTYMATGDGQNNHEYFTSVFVGATNQDNCESHHKMAAGGDILTQTGTCLVRIAVDDVISLKTADIGDTGTGNYYSSNLNLVRIGD